MDLTCPESPSVLASASSPTSDDLEKLKAAHADTLRRAEEESRQSHIYLQALFAERKALAAQNLDLQKQLDASQKGLESEVEGRKLDVASLRAEADQWRAAHKALQQETTSLRAAYDRDKERWNRFKHWWDDKIQERRSTSGKKSKLSGEERAMLQGLDLTDSPAKAAAISSEAAAIPSPVAIPSKLAPSPAQETYTLASGEPKNRPDHLNSAALLPLPTARTSTRRLRTDAAEASERVQDWLQMVDARSTMLDNVRRREGAARESQSLSAAMVPYEPSTGEGGEPTRSAGGHSQRKRRRITLPGSLDEAVVCRSPFGPSTSSDTLLQRGEKARSATPPERCPSGLEVQPTIKVESDDDAQRLVARARLATAHDEHRSEMESREDAIQRRRKKDMEDLRKNPWKYRGHGRYADELRRKNALTTDYELIPELNGGATYEHVDVIRDRRIRRQMHAHGCPCCKDYWDLVGPSVSSPVAGGITIARKAVVSTSTAASPISDAHPAPRDSGYSRVHISKADAGFQERQSERARLIALDEEEREQARLADERRQRAGKHRAWGQPPPTPEGYWDIGFPDTPRKKAINDSAKKQAAEKEWQVQRDKRYRKRRPDEGA
ncbi:hypothetical protein BCV69DRAFT_310135 [Microstroma glucosiphilum]|uniref:DNA endonuclease activator Ctp1 C-terminal domain-containing protein n=1 Tax=Pseudomicrostroma glucosiphilum TaxID=1684307 RepID=A0A316UK18_9BASI|nr:hypothetical protein BCV69DRAFT_310135 [Pseudomicrostroma glucosiphilum]PWN24313.1 hypothetical protein BCV69DRAFT_310135 [Pseudomicrostroma glucosiphilum]